MAISYNIKPYAIAKAIDELGAQETLTNLQSAIVANLASEGLTYDCPQCLSSGTILDLQSNRVECPSCRGWGKTTQQVMSVRTFSNVPSAPSVDLI